MSPSTSHLSSTSQPPTVWRTPPLCHYRGIDEEIPSVLPLFEKANTIHIRTDGACRGNPGPSSTGVYIEPSALTPAIRMARFLGPRMTNNEAEYIAAIEALELAQCLRTPQVELKMDSLLVVNQLNGKWKCKKAHLQVLLAKLVKLRRSFRRCQVSWVKREENKTADALANRALDGGVGMSLFLVHH